MVERDTAQEDLVDRRPQTDAGDQDTSQEALVPDDQEEPIVKKIDSIADVPSHEPAVKTLSFSENPSGVSATRETESYGDAAADPWPAGQDTGKLDELAAKVDELEQTLADSKTPIDDLKSGLAQAEDRIRTASGTSATISQVAQQVQSLNATVAAITGQLGGTLGYGAQHTFVCSSCQTQGKVALALKCTQCGKGNWMGWFPDQPS